MACWVYEGLLVFGVCFVAAYLFSTLSQTRHALNNRHALQAFLFVVFGIYFVWFWAKGQTLAMKTWHIRLVDTQGQPVSQRRAALRYVLSWAWLLPPLALSSILHWSGGKAAAAALVWVALWALASRLNPGHQFWHDIWAGTRLVVSPPAAMPLQHGTA